MILWLNFLLITNIMVYIKYENKGGRGNDEKFNNIGQKINQTKRNN